MEGTIVWYSPEKRMGLIKDNSGKLLVVHEDQIKKKNVDKISVGSLIKFELGNFPGFIEKVKSIK